MLRSSRHLYAIYSTADHQNNGIIGSGSLTAAKKFIHCSSTKHVMEHSPNGQMELAQMTVIDFALGPYLPSSTMLTFNGKCPQLSSKCPQLAGLCKHDWS